jgi:hypothetical protein
MYGDFLGFRYISHLNIVLVWEEITTKREKCPWTATTRNSGFPSPSAASQADQKYVDRIEACPEFI